MGFFHAVCFMCAALMLAAGQTGTASPNSTTPTTEPPPPTGHSSTPGKHTTATSPTPVTTVNPNDACSRHNGSCGDCLGEPGAKCLYCKSNGACLLYPVHKVLPPSDLCALDEARWGVCWLNFEALIIGVSVVGGVIILTITCCCIYCCCCRGGKKRKYEKEDARYNAQKMERKAKSDERRADRKERLDEIRRKYGLMKDEPYQRFEA